MHITVKTAHIHYNIIISSGHYFIDLHGMIPGKDDQPLLDEVYTKPPSCVDIGYINQLLIGWKRYPTVVTD